MTEHPAPMIAGQKWLVGVAGLCLCVWALLASNRFMARGMRAAWANPDAILLVTGFVVKYR